MYMSLAGCIVSDSESEKGWHQDDLNFISETYCSVIIRTKPQMFLFCDTDTNMQEGFG